MWRIGSRGMYKRQEVSQYQKEVKLICLSQRHTEPCDNPIRLSIGWFRPQKRGDLDGKLKIVIDALQGMLYFNDAQIVEIRAYRVEDPMNPRLEVEVEALPAYE